MSDLKNHWEKIYSSKNFNEVSWFKDNPATSINLIGEYSAKEKSIIDVGGGDSLLIQKLLEKDFKDLSVIDLSGSALKKSAEKIGISSSKINWIEGDILEFKSKKQYDLWHDWAVFHFMITPEQMKKYVSNASYHIKPGGYLLMATFSLSGPLKCSGLGIKQHSEDSIRNLFGENFSIIRSFEEIHTTPSDTKQNFIWNILKRI